MSWLKKRAEEAAKGGRCSYVYCGIEEWPICEHCAKEATLTQIIAREFAERMWRQGQQITTFEDDFAAADEDETT